VLQCRPAGSSSSPRWTGPPPPEWRSKSRVVVIHVFALPREAQFRLLLRLQSRSIKSTFFHAWLRWEGVDDRAIDERSAANWSILVLPARELTLSGKRRRGPLPNLLGPRSRYADRPGCFAPAPERRGIGSDDFPRLKRSFQISTPRRAPGRRFGYAATVLGLRDQQWPRP
jgi:hypothetical protein